MRRQEKTDRAPEHPWQELASVQTENFPVSFALRAIAFERRCQGVRPAGHVTDTSEEFRRSYRCDDNIT